MRSGLPSFELKILAALLVAMATVTATGIFAYRTMTDIVNSISEAARPDTKLSLLKDILSDLSDAESSVKSYSITNNTEYLEPFYRSAESIDEKLVELDRLSVNNSAQQPVIDSIDLLIEKKFVVLKELILSQHDDRVETTLEKISKKISDTQRKRQQPVSQQETRIEATTQATEMPVEKKPQEEQVTAPKKRNIFEKLFGRKKKVHEAAQAAQPAEEPQQELKQPEVPPAAAPAVQPRHEEAPVKEVQREIIKIKKEEAQFTRVFRKEQLELTEKDKLIMDRIRGLILQLEDDERKNIIVKTVDADDMSQKANTLIAIFCTIISVLLFILGYAIVSYTRKNRAYSKALNKAKTEAENLAEAKENFLANMSHEIRTPMNAIVGFTEQVLKTPLNPQQQEQLGIVRKSSEHLLHIINEILDLSKITAGKLQIEHIPFNPTEVINDVVVLLQHQAHRKGLSLALHIKDALPAMLSGDPVRLRQVLFNLAGNAIKFTDSGEVRIQAEAKEYDAGSVFLKISVSDTGIGIPEHKLSTVFNEFEQAESSTGRKYGGTGLGLSICKKLVELQNGRMQISSEPGKGTVVTFTLPYVKSMEKAGTEAASACVDPGRLQGKRLLVADDNEYNRRLVASILQGWNVAFTETANGREAIEALIAGSYDLVLMDMLMPEMDGLEATAFIRKQLKAEQARIPVIGLTAAVSDEVRVKCKEAGMNDVLSKPFREQELFEKICHVLFPSPDNAPQKQAAAAMPVQPAPDAPAFNLDELKRTANGDEAFVKDMVDVFIRTTLQGIEDIKESYRAKDYESLSGHAHHIASPCRHIEAYTLLRLIKQVEEQAAPQNAAQLGRWIKELEAEARALIAQLRAGY